MMHVFQERWELRSVFNFVVKAGPDFPKLKECVVLGCSDILHIFILKGKPVCVCFMFVCDILIPGVDASFFVCHVCVCTSSFVHQSIVTRIRTAAELRVDFVGYSRIY